MACGEIGDAVKRLYGCHFQAVHDLTRSRRQHGVEQQKRDRRHQPESGGVHGHGDAGREQVGLFGGVRVGHRGERLDQPVLPLVLDRPRPEVFRQERVETVVVEKEVEVVKEVEVENTAN